jgi:hypothetical protein
MKRETAVGGRCIRWMAVSLLLMISCAIAGFRFNILLLDLIVGASLTVFLYSFLRLVWYVTKPID